MAQKTGEILKCLERLKVTFTNKIISISLDTNQKVSNFAVFNF